ncbi:DUF6927 domain-containing protein [Asticcacaulis sp. W401b]|uniref:DUF6927 domain-containing protein n=1 Tax=Asticcacaulis sp. W401b TaxID=3388666 RepID=UPI0039706C09
MGWTLMRDTGGKTKKAYLDATLTWDNDKVTARPLKSAMVGSVYYAAVESVSKEDGNRSIWAAVFLTKSCSRAKDGYTFGYKDMTEDMGPVESRCPAGILDLLTETKSDYALAWRERCRAGSKVRAKAKPSAGCVIRLKEPIAFTDNTTHQEFTVVAYPWRGRTRTAYRAGNGQLYRISNIQSREFEVVLPASA